MFIFAILVLFLAVTQKNAMQDYSETTLPVQQRLALLKHQIKKDLKINRHNKKRIHNDVSVSLEKVEYDDIDNQPITPINENDERKKYGRFRLRPIKTTTETSWAQKPTKKVTTKSMKKQKKVEVINEEFSEDFSDSEEKKPKLLGIEKIFRMASKNKTKKLRHGKIPNYEMQAENIFYRRIFEGEFKKRCSKETIHCTDLLTPVLTGQKQNVTTRILMSYKNYEVMRLLQLLSEDTSEFTKEEIYSNLYQISNLQIRLFQWDIASLKLLFNVLTKAKVKRHTFKTIKAGLKSLLGSWHLDFTNVTNLLHQARIFRPPCIANNYAGSTQSSRVVRYTKKVKPKCPENKKSSGSCEL